MDQINGNHGFIEYEYAKQHLLNHKKHLQKSIKKLPENSAQYSHCQKELQAIQELLGSEGLLAVYVNNWNQALKTLYDLRSAIKDYGFVASGLFNLEFLNKD